MNEKRTTRRDSRPAWIGRAAAILLIVPLASVRAAEPLSIRHRAVDCLVAAHPPVFSACFDPPERLARARLFFRVGQAGWQTSDFRPEGACFSSVLPAPRRSDHELRYFVEAVDVSTASTRLPEKTVRVVPDTAACGEGVVAPFQESLAGAGTSGSRALPFTLGAVALGGGAYAVAGRRGAGGTGGPAVTSAVSGAPATGPTPAPSASPSPSPRPDPCVGDTTGPTVTIDMPAENTILSTSPVTVRASAADANGVVSIEVFARRPITGATSGVGGGTSSPVQVSWAPECNSALWTLFARATDACHNTSTSGDRRVTVAVATLSICL